jgi:hypothetical protein
MSEPGDLLSVETPESVAFAYELAGIGSRGLAFALDSALLALIILAEVIVIGAAAVVFFYLTRRDAGPYKTTISQYLDSSDTEYIVLTRLAQVELQRFLIAKDYSDWRTYMNEHATHVVRLEGDVAESVRAEAVEPGRPCGIVVSARSR